MIYGRFNYAPGDPVNDAVLLWMNYFGGSGNDKPIAAHFSSAGRLYFVGWTDSDDLPMHPLSDPGDGTFYQDIRKGEEDGYILVSDTLGSWPPFRVSYYGGEGKDMFTAIAEDQAGDLYFAGATATDTGSYASCGATSAGLPLCDPGGGAYQQTGNAGDVDAFVVKIDPDFFMLWSTFYGGTGANMIYDAAYRPDPVGLQDRVIFVGASCGAVPPGDSALFYLPGTADTTGFIVTFDHQGRLKWETNIHRTARLEAAVAVKDYLVVQGVTEPGDSSAASFATEACSAVPGYLSICDPGGTAYVDSVVRRKDEYYAQFAMPSGQLVWGTTFGGWVWEAADITVDLSEAHYQTHPFPIRRFGDMELDLDGNLFAMGIAEQVDWDIFMYTMSHPTQSAWGFYDKVWDQSMGLNQTEITLKCFDADRSLYWSTTFGSQFTHVNDIFDLGWLPKGCDWGADLVLVDGKALYCVGSTGGVNFDDACPYPGVSWCEPTFVFVGDDPDFLNGFVARMNVQGLNIGIPELQTTGTALSCYPNPTGDRLYVVSGTSNLVGNRVEVLDALGRMVLATSLDQDASLRVGSLAKGGYAVRIIDQVGEFIGATRFLRN